MFKVLSRPTSYILVSLTNQQRKMALQNCCLGWAARFFRTADTMEKRQNFLRVQRHELNEGRVVILLAKYASLRKKFLTKVRDTTTVAVKYQPLPSQLIICRDYNHVFIETKASFEQGPKVNSPLPATMPGRILTYVYRTFPSPPNLVCLTKDFFRSQCRQKLYCTLNKSSRVG